MLGFRSPPEGPAREFNGESHLHSSIAPRAMTRRSFLWGPLFIRFTPPAEALAEALSERGGSDLAKSAHDHEGGCPMRNWPLTFRGGRKGMVLKQVKDGQFSLTLHSVFRPAKKARGSPGLFDLHGVGGS